MELQKNNLVQIEYKDFDEEVIKLNIVRSSQCNHFPAKQKTGYQLIK